MSGRQGRGKMSETPSIKENTYNHWVLFALGWAEEREKTPIQLDKLSQEMGEIFTRDTIQRALSRLHDNGLLYETPTTPRSYSLSEMGKDALLEREPPTGYPQGTSVELSESLTIPDSVHERPSQPETLRIDESENTSHLYREDAKTGELLPLCRYPTTPSHRPSSIRTVTSEELNNNYEEKTAICDCCTEREEFTTWSDNTTSDDRGSPHSEQTRWDRYQQWIDEHDFSDSVPPDAKIEGGRVLVSSRYTDNPTPRKLHAYIRAETDDGDELNYFTSLCGRATEREHPDSLQPILASSFVTRADACKHCQQMVDDSEETTFSPTSAETVEYDPFNVFSKEPEPAELTPSTGDAGEDIIRCPDCGRQDFDSQKALTLHWAHPGSDCDYPVPTKREQSILTGLWLTNGSIEGRKTPNLRKTSIKKDALEWLASELGIWGSSVTKASDKNKQQQAVETGFGYENAQSKQQYRLTTRTCPWLTELAGKDASDVELTPLIAQILYSFQGHIIDNSVLALRHRKGDALKACLETAGFEVRRVELPPEGKNQYRLTLSASASREFADWIESPLPGFENKALEFRDSHDHKERVRDDMDAESHKVPETISFEPEWEWVGVQLYKIGLNPLAIRAFKQDLTPAEVYGQGGVQDIIYNAAHDSRFDIDMGSISGGVTLHETPVPDEEIARVRRKLGLSATENGGDSNGGTATY